MDARLKPVRREELERPRTETLVSELASRPNILLMVCYCPPSDNPVLLETLSTIQDVVFLNPTKSVIITGDFNIPNIHWTASDSNSWASPTLSRACRRAVPFLETCQLSGLRQHVIQPTRGNNVLDLVLSTAGVQLDATVQDGIISSDHKEVFCSIVASHPSVPLATRNTAFNYKRADWDGLRLSLRLLPWRDLLSDPCVNKNVDRFYSLLEAAIKDSIPTVTFRRRHAPWFDGELRALLAAKEAAFRRKKRNPTTDAVNDVSDKRRAFKAASSQKYREYLKQLVYDFKDNPKRFWSYVKCVKSSKAVPTVLTYGGAVATTDAERANLLNCAFAAKFSPPYTGLLPECPAYNLTNVTEFSVTHNAVLRMLESVQANKACGPDGISGRIVRECASELAVPLTVLIAQSLSQGVFPSRWKEANVVPVHKKGSYKLATNYRSISLLPLFGKILERVVNENLFAHVRSALSSRQHGFIPARSCESNLSTFVRAGWEAINKGNQLDCIYTDFTSAFQSVDHRLLLHKLKNSYSIDGKALAILESFLADRRQRVVLNGQISSWNPVISGTPEGSQISPLLFLLFINDLPVHIQSECLMYADDVKLYREVQTASDVDLLRSDLARLVHWSSVWKLQLNASKCKVLTFTLKRKPIVSSYSINGVVLENVTAMRDLGVILDQKLTFQPHIDSIVRKSNMSLGLLMRSLQTGCRGTKFRSRPLISAYCANVRSVLEYCSVVWGGAAKTHMDRIERVQHKFLMWLAVHTFGAPQNLDYNRLLLHFSLCSLSARRTQHDLTFLARLFKHKIDSPFLRSCFGLAVPPRHTRQLALFAVPFARVETIKMGAFCRLPREMNLFLQSFNYVDLFVDTLGSTRSYIFSYTRTLVSG